jgi:hypothetical protein
MRNVVLAGSGSHSDPARRGSPAEDGRESVRAGRPDTGASGNLLRRFDDAFTRTFTAMAMAEDGTRALALEMLEGASGADADSTPGPNAGPLAESA